MLDVVFGLINLLSTWRFFLVLVIAVSLAFALAMLLPAGVPRVAVVVLGALAGISFGTAWQRHQEKTTRSGK